MLYPVAFIALALALFIWTVLQDRSAQPLFRGISLLAIFLFLAVWWLQPAPLAYKLGIVARDLLVIGGVGALYAYVAQRRKWFLVLAVATILGGYLYVNKTVRYSFPFSEGDSGQQLAPDGEWLVELRSGLQAKEKAQLDRWMQRHQAQYREAFPQIDLPDQTELDDFIVVDLPEQGNHTALRQSLQALSFVEYIEANEQIQLQPLVALSSRGQSQRKANFGLDDPAVSELWSFPLMKMEELYRLLEDKVPAPAHKALVAILDTGVDAQHEDLEANYHSVDSNSDRDQQGHGTHCAGIAAAVSNNGKGRASFSRANTHVEVTSIQVLNNSGIGTQQSIIKGIIRAADEGAAVISLSLGGPSNDARQRAYTQAVAYANQQGAIVVAAAGNAAANASRYSPVNAQNVIGVAAVDAELKRASFSNSVENIPLGLAAPGVAIYSTIPNHQYATYNGTSMATPYVAGLLGVMKSIRPELTTEAAFQILSATGRATQNPSETGAFIQPAAAIEQLLLLD